MKQSTLLTLKGFCMGAADVVPGVSGGTMAYILGIYEKLLAAINSFDLIWFKALATFRISTVFSRPHFTFIIPLFIGIITAIICFTKIIPLPVFITTHPELIYGLFFGLIVGSIILLMKRAPKRTLKDIMVLCAGILFGFCIVNLVPVETPNASWFIFLCGCVAITAMLLPGISGSFILLILNKYAYILGAIAAFEFTIIGVFIAGCITGLMIFSRAIAWMMEHYHMISLRFINGILIGSLWVIWPFQERKYIIIREKSRLISSTPMFPEQFDSTTFLSLLLMLAGFIAVILLQRAADYRAKLEIYR